MHTHTRDAFSGLHPFVNFIYFAFVIGLALASLNPICLGISCAGALAYSACLKGAKASLRKNVPLMLVIILLVAVINPLFSHQGVTVLAYFPTGNALTLESILYGVASGAMLAAVLIHFSSVNVVLTSDKMIYLFARVFPSFGLVLSMTLKFIPEFVDRVKQTYKLAKINGEASGMKKVRAAIGAVSQAVTWALERGIITGDSMKSRGYDTGKRTVYSLYKFYLRDVVVLVITLALGAFVVWGFATGTTNFFYYPETRFESTATAVFVYVAYGGLAALPSLMHGMDR